MRKITLYCFLLILALTFGHRTAAQETNSGDAPKPQETAKPPEAPAHFYHLVFVIQELGPDGKPTNSRSYTTTVSTDTRDKGMFIRTSSRVPVATGSFSTDANKAAVNTQYQYVNFGVDIDTHNAREIGRELSIELTADVSSLADSRNENPHEPTIRQNKWQATVLIPIGKPTTVFTSDTLDNKGSMQLVVTASPLQ